jgi:hypothetical protein
MVMLLKLLKWVQLAVALCTTAGLSLLLPSVEGILGVPLGCLYVLWAVRALQDHWISKWLAFLFDLFVAAFVGRVVIASVPILLGGQATSLAYVLPWLILFLMVAAVVLLHVVSWRWLLLPAGKS